MVDRSNQEAVARLGPGAIICQECPAEAARVFLDEQGHQAHRHREHGHRAAARDFVIDNTCPACGKAFRSRPAAIEHLNRRAVRCRRRLDAGELQKRAPEAIAAADAADRAAELRRRVRVA